MRKLNVLIAGSTGKIRGEIFEKSTGEKLTGCNVNIINTSYGSYSDNNGNFIILNII